MHTVLGFGLVTGSVFFISPASLRAAEVKIVTDSAGRHTLLRDGKHYMVKGACWPTAASVESLVASGGNSVRTYAEEIEWMLPLAKKHGLSVMLGLPIGRERQSYDYRSQAANDAQLEILRGWVRRYKNEPNLLMWAIGNEPELMGKNTVPLWKEVGRIARMIREDDPHHPIVTVIAGFDERKIKEIITYSSELDALGVNWYGEADKWPDDLRKFGWNKPYLITEFGPLGFWEGSGNAPNTSWGAPPELTSTEKASLYAKTWKQGVTDRLGQSLGGYPFIWYWKQEKTPTWFGMYLKSGERLAAVEAMSLVWRGKNFDNPAPEILSWELKKQTGEFKPQERLKILFTYRCNRPVNVKIELHEESTAEEVGGDAQAAAKHYEDYPWKKTVEGIEMRAPKTPGNYRIFLYLKTDDKTAATANVPIRVIKTIPK